MTWPTTSRQSRGYGKDHERIRKELMSDPDQLWCQECRKEGRWIVGTICDHIVNQARGGRTEQANAQMLCDPCSARKTACEAGRTSIEGKGTGRDGRPTSPDHPWNRTR